MPGAGLLKGNTMSEKLTVARRKVATIKFETKLAREAESKHKNLRMAEGESYWRGYADGLEAAADIMVRK